jgi:hypothetical protein
MRQASPPEWRQHHDPFHFATNRTIEIRQPDIHDNGINA